MMNEYTDELFQVYDRLAAPNREQRQVFEMNSVEQPQPIRQTMRQSQLLRLFWSKLLLCWMSVLLILYLVYRHDSQLVGPTLNNYPQVKGGSVSGFYWGHHHDYLRTNNGNRASMLEYINPSSLQKHSYAHVREQQRFQDAYAPYAEPQPNVERDEKQGTQISNSSPSQVAEDTESVEAHASAPAIKNPATYGWTPAAFPDPVTNPIRCAIAYLPRESITMSNEDPDNNDNNSKDSMDNGQMMSPLEIDQLQQQQQNHPLRLCDPDWVLGGKSLESVALAMGNFTRNFGRARHDELVLQRQEAWESVPPGERVKPERIVPWVDLAIATARKMDLTTVLRDSTYYAYEDDDDMVNEAAQLFAHGLHDAWWPASASDEGLVSAEHGILLFLSIQDRVCFISTGAAISSVLPWWRLDHIVTSMKPALRERDYGAAILEAVKNLSGMLRAGPPSMIDRLHDFCARFGVVILFAAFTFFFGAWGEYRDRKKRFQFAEERSQIKGTDREKACLLQQGYKTRQCPICLESFQSDKAAILSDNYEGDKEEDELQTRFPAEDGEGKNDNLDTYGIPLLGADGKRIKMLRCGHIFCESCWKSWVNSGCGNPCNCPVCRQDIGKAPKQSSRRNDRSRRSVASAPEMAEEEQESLPRERESHPFIGVIGSTRRLRDSTFWETHPSYDSVSQSRRSPQPSTSLESSTTAGLNVTDENDTQCEAQPTERQPLLSRPS